jgi:hypothetical protein
MAPLSITKLKDNKNRKADLIKRILKSGVFKADFSQKLNKEKQKREV